MTTEVINAQISRTAIGDEDHGILTAVVEFKFDGSTQSFPLYDLRTVACGPFIKGLLSALRAQTWEELKGTYVRIERTDGMIKRVGHIGEDRWFDPDATVKTAFLTNNTV